VPEHLTPQEKKRREYDWNHHTEAEHPHAFRKGWPRKKARANRRLRRRAAELVRSVGAGPAEEVMEAAEARAVTREHVRDSLDRTRVHKSGVFSLRERVARKRRARLFQPAQAFFYAAYSPDRDRERFAAYLESLVAARGEGAAELAAWLESVLAVPGSAPETAWLGRDRRWLCDFFADEPGWEPRLRAWIRSVLHPEPAPPSP
jgi:hypothetical protein